MPPREQKSVYPFVKGVNQGDEDPLVTSGLHRMENCLVTRKGAIDKRYGKTALSGTHTQDILGVQDDRLFLVGETTKAKNENDSFDTAGIRMGLVDVSSEPVRSAPLTQLRDPDMAFWDDYALSVANGTVGGTVKAMFRGYCVSSKSQVGSLYSPTSVSGANSRAIAVSGQSGFYGFYVDASNHLQGFSNIPSAGGSWSKGSDHDFNGDSWPDVDAAVPIDVALIDTDEIMVVYKEDSSDNIITGVVTVSGATLTAGTHTSTARTDLVWVTVEKWDTGVGLVAYATYGSGTTVVKCCKFSNADPPALSNDVQLGTYDTTYTGTGDSIDADYNTLNTRCQLTDSAATFTDSHIGQWITISGAEDDSDVFPIVARTSATVIEYYNPDGVDVTEGFTWSIATVGEFCQAASCVATEGSKAYVYWTLSEAPAAGTTAKYLALYRNTYNGTAASTATRIGGDVTLWAKPFVDSDSHIYVPCHFTKERHTDATTLSGDSQRKFILLRDDLETAAGGYSYPVPVAQWMPLSAGEQDLQGYKRGAVCTISADGTGIWRTGGLEVLTNRDGNGGFDAAVYNLIRLDTTVASAVTRQTSRELVVPNSIPYVVPSEGVGRTIGPLVYPEGVAATVYATAEGTLSAGDYGYRAVYETTDAHGNRYISGVSPVVTATVTADDMVSVEVPTLKFLRDWAGTYAHTTISLYRSDEVNGTEYRLLAQKDNDPDREVIHFADEGSTDNSSAEEELTRNNALLNHAPAYPFRVSAVHQQRLFVADRQYEDRLVRYSREFVEGEGTHFSSELYFRVDPTGGAITALESLADSLIIFKRKSLYMVSGLAMTDGRVGEGYTEPRLISDGVGCVDQRSILRVPNGIMFQSDDCIYLLGSDFSLSPVGRPVKHQTDSLSIIATARLEDYNLALFFSATTCLTYNYLLNAWGTWTNFGATDAAVANAVLYVKDASASTIYKWDTSTYLDDGPTDVTPAVETPWLHLAGQGGFARLWEVRLSGYTYGSGDLTVQTAYDGTHVWVDSETYDASQLSSIQPSDHYGAGLASGTYLDEACILRFRGSRTKCESVKFRFSWSGS